MFSSINKSNLNINTLNVAVDKKNLTYILKFKLFLSIALYINFCLILNNIYIDNLIIGSNI